MTIEQIRLKSLLHPVEELKLLSEDDDIYVIFRLCSYTCDTYRIEPRNKYRVRPLKWLVGNKSKEDLEALVSDINRGYFTVARFKYD